MDHAQAMRHSWQADCLALSSLQTADTDLGSEPQTSSSRLLLSPLACACRLMVIFHPPWYNSYVGGYYAHECFRQNYESLFYTYGVDIVMHGHIHAYERTDKVYNYVSTLATQLTDR